MKQHKDNNRVPLQINNPNYGNNYQYPKQTPQLLYHNSLPNPQIDIKTYNPSNNFSLNVLPYSADTNHSTFDPLRLNEMQARYPKPQLRLQKIQPKYIDSTYRTSFIPVFNTQKSIDQLPVLDYHSKKIEEIINFTRQQ